MDVLKTGIERVLYPYMENRKGNRIRSFTQQLQNSEKLSAGQLQALQRDRLAAYLQHCRENVPAYSGLDPDLIVSDPYAALRSVPPLEKRTFRDDPAQFLAANADPKTFIPNKSGGSTGLSVHFVMDRQQVEQYEAARWRGLAPYGISNGSRCLMVWGTSIEKDERERRKEAREDFWLKNRKVLSAYEMNEDSGEEYIEAVNSYRPEYLYGYSSALVIFANAIEKAGLEKLNADLKAVVASADTLFPWQAEYLEQVFRCPVVNEYGAKDAGILAMSCPCGHMHIAAENVVIEVLDPRTLQPLPAGETGLIAVTDLANLVHPRLRYLLGDTGCLLEEKCSCGRALPLMKAPEGREDAFLAAENGRLVHGVFTNQIIRDYKTVRGFQLIQHTPESATLRLVADPAETDGDEIAEKLSRNLPGVAIAVEYTDRIEPMPSGKIRYTVREFDL